MSMGWSPIISHHPNISIPSCGIHPDPETGSLLLQQPQKEARRREQTRAKGSRRRVSF
jgi:hypothetical protein